MDRGMDWFNGNLVAKAELDAVNALLANSQARVTALEAQLLQANEGRVSESNLLTAANAQVATLTTERDTLKAENESLKAGAITLDAAAAAKAREIVAAQGIPAGSVPAASGSIATSQEQELEQVRAQMATEQDIEKRALLARRARVLRGHADLLTPQPTT